MFLKGLKETPKGLGDSSKTNTVCETKNHLMMAFVSVSVLMRHFLLPLLLLSMNQLTPLTIT